MTPFSVVMTRSHLPALDGLRALAVGIVIVYHAGYGVPGDLGVTGFFVLSGFLITWLLSKELNATGVISFSTFYTSRTLRIFPAYYAFVAFSLAWDWIRHDPWTGGRMAAAFLYFINYHNAVLGVHDGPVAHAWSLAIEEQFYLLWPFVFLLLARCGMARVRWALALAITAVLLWRSFLYVVVDTGSAWVYNAFDCRADSLAIGCLLATLVNEPRVLRIVRRLSHPALPILTLVILAVSRSATPATYHYSIGFTVNSLLIGVLIVQLLQVSEFAGWRWLDWRAVRYVGRISYPMYLWHGVAISAAMRFAADRPTRLLLGTLLTVLVASCSYYVIEQPALRLKGRLRGRPVVAQPVVLAQ
jgi:peptidoglycan/LPS O-acetylase OafA/YrhL